MNSELERAAELATQYLDSLGRGPVSRETTPEMLRARLQKELTASGVPALEEGVAVAHETHANPGFGAILTP